MTRLTRFKHWFQYTFTSINNEEENYGLVISIVRNAYDWVEAMRLKPHHSLAHWNLTSNAPLSWDDFVTREWTLDRRAYSKYLSGEDLGWIEKVENGSMSQEELLNMSCHHDHILWRHIVPCSISDRKASAGMTRVTKGHAMYELNYDQSGLPYKSIVELRRDKILDFFDRVPTISGVNHFLPVRYEDLVSQGSAILLRSIEKSLGVEAKCEPLQPQRLKRRKMPQLFVEWLNENLDWEVEALVGYGKANSTDGMIPTDTLSS